MPPNTVYVGRPTKWGNPFKCIGDMMCVYSIKRKVLDPWILWDHQGGYDDQMAVYLYMEWLNGDFNDYDYIAKPPKAEEISELKGKDLACWCEEGEPCHADVLLACANREPVVRI
jgi:hypothetical protein